MELLIWGGVGYASAFVFHISLSPVLVTYLLTLWLMSFMVHQVVLIEHGNLIVEGSLEIRNMQTRNLRNHGIFEKLLLVFMHQDCREHLLHHTRAGNYNRPFVGKYPMPEDAVYISLAEYMGILKRMLLGEEQIITIANSTIRIAESLDKKN
jgi:hypothetical protein